MLCSMKSLSVHHRLLPRLAAVMVGWFVSAPCWIEAGLLDERQELWLGAHVVSEFWGQMQCWCLTPGQSDWTLTLTCLRMQKVSAEQLIFLDADILHFELSGHLLGSTPVYKRPISVFHNEMEQGTEVCFSSLISLSIWWSFCIPPRLPCHLHLLV